MLSLFPQILFLSVVAPTLIRITLTCMLSYSAWKHSARPTTLVRMFSIVEIMTAAALFAGAWVQAVAIVAVTLSLVMLIHRPLRTWPASTISLMLVMAATLIVTGAGAFAFDLPL